MNILEYARLISQDQQMEEGWLLVRRDDGTEAIERYDEDPKNIFDNDDEARYFVAECAAQTVYLIRDRLMPLCFWNNTGDWGELASASVYSADEKGSYDLPAFGQWVALNPHFGVRHVD